MAEKQLECKLAVRKTINEQASSAVGISAVEFVEVWKQRSKEGKKGRHYISGSVKGQGQDKCEVMLWQGSMHGQLYSEDANVGRYAVFHASTEEGCEMMVRCVSLISWGYASILFHDRIEIDLKNGLRIASATGFDSEDTAGGGDDYRTAEKHGTSQRTQGLSALPAGG